MKIKELIIDYSVDKMNFNNIENFIVKDKKEIHLFTHDGVIEVSSDKMMKKSYVFDKPSYIVENYYNDISLYINQNKSIFKKVNQIPLEYVEKQVEKTIYKTHRGSKVSLVYELYDKEMEKAYFLIDGDEDDIMIKEDICSLLDKIM